MKKIDFRSEFIISAKDKVEKKKCSLICRNRKIVIPKRLEKQVVELCRVVSQCIMPPQQITYRAKYFSTLLLEEFA